MTATGQTHDTVLVETGVASEEAMAKGGDEGGQKGRGGGGGEECGDLAAVESSS